MTKQEILDLISAKIEGQGNQVDAGSSLGEILRGILEIAESGGNPTPVAPLKVADNELSLELGAGLETDAEDKLAAKLKENGGLAFNDDGTLQISDELIATAISNEPQTQITESQYRSLVKSIAIRHGNNIYPRINPKILLEDNVVSLGVYEDLDLIDVAWGTLSYTDSNVVNGATVFFIWEDDVNHLFFSCVEI